MKNVFLWIYFTIYLNLLHFGLTWLVFHHFILQECVGVSSEESERYCGSGWEWSQQRKVLSLSLTNVDCDLRHRSNWFCTCAQLYEGPFHWHWATMFCSDDLVILSWLCLYSALIMARSIPGPPVLIDLENTHIF